MKENAPPNRVTINWLASCSGMHFNTVRKRLAGLESDQNGKFDRVTALGRLYVGEDGEMTYSEVQKRLALEKTKQIQLQNEVTRKERIPIGIVMDIHDQTLQAMTATLKASVGKVMTVDRVNEILTGFREIPDKLHW
jgi:hypothetical protein